MGSDGDGALTEKSSVTIDGRLDVSGINLYKGNFRIIVTIAEEVSISGGYENANGVPVDSNNTLNDAFAKEGFPVPVLTRLSDLPKPPDLSNYMKSGDALYILNGNLKQIGAIPNITELGVGSVEFNGNTVTLTLYNGKINLDLSNPTAPKVK